MIGTPKFLVSRELEVVPSKVEVLHFLETWRFCLSSV
jgi:hypothetical protein